MLYGVEELWRTRTMSLCLFNIWTTAIWPTISYVPSQAPCLSLFSIWTTAIRPTISYVLSQAPCLCLCSAYELLLPGQQFHMYQARCHVYVFVQHMNYCHLANNFICTKVYIITAAKKKNCLKINRTTQQINALTHVLLTRTMRKTGTELQASVENMGKEMLHLRQEWESWPQWAVAPTHSVHTPLSISIASHHRCKNDVGFFFLLYIPSAILNRQKGQAATQ